MKDEYWKLEMVNNRIVESRAVFCQQQIEIQEEKENETFANMFGKLVVVDRRKMAAYS